VAREVPLSTLLTHHLLSRSHRSDLFDVSESQSGDIAVQHFPGDEILVGRVALMGQRRVLMRRETASSTVDSHF
jgi:hypothetical protein